MAGSLSISWMLQTINSTVLCGAGIFTQTAVILAAGLGIAHLLRKRGAAAQSLALRAFLAAAFLGPLAAALLHTAGVPRIQFTLIPASLSSPAGPHAKSPLAFSPDSETPPVAAPPSGGVQPSARHYTNSLPGPGTPPEAAARPNGLTFRAPAAAPSVKPSSGHPAAREQSSPPIPAPPYFRALLYIAFTLLWAAMTLALLLRLLSHHLAVSRLRRTAFPAKTSFAESCRSVAAEVGLTPPPVLQHPEVRSPFLTGFLRPCILLPLGEGELTLHERSVFLHELAHLARHDTIWNLIRHIAVALLPFQPLLWVLSRRIEETSDFVCDDFVTRHSVSGRTYAASLMDTAWAFQPARRETAAGVGFISFASSLRRRIARILDTSRTITLRVGKRMLVLVSSLCLCITFLSGLVGFRGKSFAQARKFSEVLSRGGMPAAIAALTLIKEQATRKLQSSEPTASSDLQKDTPPSVAETVLPADQSAPPTPGVPDFPAQDPVAQESAEAPSESVPGIAFSSDYMAQNTGANTINTASPRQSIEKSSKKASADSLWQRWLPNNSVKALTPKVNTDFTPAALDVLIPYNYKDADKAKPEEKRWSDIYEAADRDQINPIWSPDGKSIVFSDASYSIWKVSASGGEPVLIYDNYHKAQYGNYNLQLSGLKPLGFSADGKKVAFAMETISVENGTVVDIIAYQPTIYYRIWKAFPVIAEVNADTGVTSIIVEDSRSGAWSSDGKSFVYQRDSVPELHLKNIETGMDKTLLNGVAIAPRFTPSGKYIVFSREMSDGTMQIYRIPANGGTPEQLTHSEDGETSESCIVTDCSPNSEWLLFTCTQGERSTLEVYNMVTGSRHNLFTDEKVFLNSGKFAPDGRKICYSLTADDMDGTVHKLFTCDFTLGTEATTTQVLEHDGVPPSFALIGNYPNPFNLLTTIQFSLPSTGFIRLTIYNIMGQKIRELAAREMESGTHSILWDGRDDRGHTVSTGVYITHLQWGTHTATRRIAIIK